jgi:hypothetical protein
MFSGHLSESSIHVRCLSFRYLKPDVIGLDQLF